MEYRRQRQMCIRDRLIIADGGIQKNHLNSLEDIGVDIAVQGGAIFG